MKETHYKLKHRVTALFAAAVMLCSMLPGAAFAEEPTPQPTEETAQMEQQTEPSETDNGQTDESSPDPGEDVTEATPETAEEQPAEEEIPAAVVGAELYTDLPDAPIGSYIGSEGLPVATGETKIGISEWPESQLEEGGSYLTAAALDNDGLTMAAPLLDGADYAIVPIMAQVEYPADGSSTDMILPDGVTLLDFYGEPATDADALLHNSYHETSAAVMGVYVQAAADFTAQLVYTGPDGSTQIKTLYVTIDREHTVASPFADAGIAAYGERPIPNVTSGKITKVAKVNSTWLIWFNGDEAYCCTPGADGQPKNCPTYTYVNTSMVGADQYVPGDHYGNQYRIWGGLTQLSLGMQEFPPVALSAEAPSLLDFCRTIYTDAQMQIIENYPDSTAAKILIGSAQTLLEGTDAYASALGYYTYIYQPGRAGWQTVAVIGPEISDDEPNPKPIVQEIYANWEAPAQTASGSFDFAYGIITDKVQLKTTEKVDAATIEIEPITKSGTIDGGTWNISPADKQTVTTAGHTNDDNYQNNGGAASASWTLHYSVSKTTDSRSGRVGPYTTQDEADAAADSARDAAIAELQGEAQRMVDNAVASAKAELANVKFRYEEVGVPYGFEMYWGSNGSNQTISVPANSNNAYQMKNDEWSLQVNIRKTDSETGNQIAADAQYEIFQWDTVTGKYQPTGGYNTYSVQRQGDGTYAVINSAAYAVNDAMRHTLYYTQRNQGKFILVETKAPAGYFGDWTDIDHPGTAGTPLGKRGYYIEITEANDNAVLWLDNADYNADVAAADKGGTKLVTSTGVETTVTIYDTAKDPSRTYNTDNSGKAANEDSYTITPTDGAMKNDRTLGEISMTISEYPQQLDDKFISALLQQVPYIVLSIDIEPVETEDAFKEIDSAQMKTDAEKVRFNKKSVENLDFTSSVPQRTQEQDRIIANIRKEMTENDQQMFLSLLTVTYFADTLEDLALETDALKTTAANYNCRFTELYFQQERAFNTAMPYGLRRIESVRTMLTKSLTALVPFNTQEILTPGGICYGRNAVTGNLIIGLRTTLVNGNQQTRRRLTLDLKPGSGSSNLQTSAKIQRIKICTRPLRRLRPRR